MNPNINPNYNRLNKFKMNKVRREQMESLIDMLTDKISEHTHDKEMKEMFQADKADASYILECLNEGNFHLAVRAYKNCDTAARDEYPQWVAELAGFKIYNHNKYTSMEATEEK